MSAISGDPNLTPHTDDPLQSAYSINLRHFAAVATGLAAVAALSPLVNPKFRNMVGLATIATGAAIAAVLSPWEPAKIAGTTVLTGVTYGIANDMIACRDCIEYFTAGHFYDGKNLKNRPLLTLNPNLNALVWGAVATWWTCVPTAAIFAFLARVPLPGSLPKISAKQLSPFLGGIAALSSCGRTQCRKKRLLAF